MTVKEEIKEFIWTEIFEEQGNKEELTYDIDLVALNILDSLAVLKLVQFLEEQNDFTIDIAELDFEKFNCINSIHDFLIEKNLIA